MAAGKLKLSIEQGATYRKPLVWKTGTPAVAVNLTGFTARMQVRSSVADSGTPLLSLTTENGGIVITPLTGTIELYISAAGTTAITWTTGVYDLELISPTGDVTRLVFGGVAVSPGVTK